MPPFDSSPQTRQRRHHRRHAAAAMVALLVSVTPFASLQAQRIVLPRLALGAVAASGEVRAPLPIVDAALPHDADVALLASPSPLPSPQRGRYLGHEHNAGCRIVSAALAGTAFALAAAVVAAPLAILEMDSDHPEKTIIRIQIAAGTLGAIGGLLSPIF